MADGRADEVEAVARLRSAMIGRERVAEAARAAFYKNPAFCSVNLAGMVYGWLADRDPAEVTSLIERISAARGDRAGFPARDAEDLGHMMLGEGELTPRVASAEVNYPEIALALLGEQLPQPAGAFHRPRPLRPLELLADLRHAGPDPEPADLSLRSVDRPRGMRPLVRVDSIITAATDQPFFRIR